MPDEVDGPPHLSFSTPFTPFASIYRPYYGIITHDYITNQFYCSGSFQNSQTKPKPILKTKCYSARTGLKRDLTDQDKIQINALATEYYKGCRHCGWYSWIFFNHKCAGAAIIKNKEDLEKVKQQFTNHMNRSHKDICKRKMMSYITPERKDKYK